MLRLQDLIDTFPPRWLAFAPSPIDGYVESVEQTLLRLGVAAPGDRAFRGFCGVPRFFHPRADAEALVLSLELICWYFYFDDPFDDARLDVTTGEAGGLVDRMLGVLVHGDLPADASGCERLCWRFRERARRMSGHRPAPWERFTARCADWVTSILPINRRLRTGLPDLEEYKALRLINVGILPEFPLAEIIGGMDLRPEFLSLPEVGRFEELAALVIAYCNDVYSYERETRSRTQLNSLELRQRLAGGSLERAYAEQVRDVADMIADMQAIEDRLRCQGLVGLSDLDDPSSEARARRDQTRYLEDIKAIVVGNHLWSLSDGRYHSPTSPFFELRGVTTERRKRAGVAPPSQVAVSLA